MRVHQVCWVGGMECARFEISVNTDILILEFYEYIENIGEISVNILTKISIKQKWFKIHENT